MKVSTTQVLKNLKGEEMKIATSEIEDGKEIVKQVPMEFRDLVTNALNSETQEHRLTPELKTKAFQIMKKLWDSKEANLTLEQRNLIVERVKLFYTTMVAGIVEELLEGKDEEPKKEG